MTDDFIDPIFEDRDASFPAAPHVRPEPEVPAAQPVQPQQPVARRPDQVPGPDERKAPTALQPTEQVVPRAAATAATVRTPQPDDRICSSCHLSNSSHRNFCERCGATLTETQLQTADAPLPPTWWQRFTRWLSRLVGRGGKQQARSASRGARVAYRRGLSLKNQAVRILGLLGIVGGGLFVADVGPASDIRDTVTNRLNQQTVELRASSISVVPPDAEILRWSAVEIADGRDNTAWGVEWGTATSPAASCEPGTRARGRLRLTFDQADVSRIDFVLGLPEPNFENTGRPTRIGLIFSSSQTCQIFALEDQHAEQSIEFDKVAAESLELWILDAVTDGADDPELLLISELEVFGTR